MMLSSLKLPKELRKRVETELQPGESIKWIAQPIPRFFTATSVVTVLFGIPWTCFALFWMWGAAGSEIPDLSKGVQPQYIFALFGLPFLLIGFGMLSTPLWLWQTARETVYLITDRRAISIEKSLSTTTIRSYAPHELGHVYRRERPDGTGDVIIVKREWRDSEGDHMTEEVGFTGIRNPRDSERVLKQLAQKAT